MAMKKLLLAGIAALFASGKNAINTISALLIVLPEK
jgi:hypothetical protein